MNAITNNRWITLMILLLLTANIVTLVLLWTHKSNSNILPGQPAAPVQVFEFVTKELQLDAAQQQVYKTLREEHQQGQRPLQDSIRKAKDNFFTLLQQPAANDTAVQLLSSKVAAAEQQLEIFTFRHFQKLRAICNGNQQKMFDSIIKNVLQQMAPGRRPGPPPPGMEHGDRMPPPHEGPPPPQ
ncbi:MAG: periplasmic heavy metal sensor [Ferruginibacter sp.]